MVVDTLRHDRPGAAVQVDLLFLADAAREPQPAFGVLLAGQGLEGEAFVALPRDHHLQVGMAGLQVGGGPDEAVELLDGNQPAHRLATAFAGASDFA